MAGGRRVEFEAGTVIVAEGQSGTEVYVLESARCVVSVRGEVVSTMRPGELFGEIGALDGGLRTATVTTLDRCTVTVFTSAEIRSQLSADPLFLRNTLRSIALRARGMAAREEEVRGERRELIDEQLRLQHVQRALLPDLAPLNRDPRLRVEAEMRPCTYAGGDYYDVLRLDDDEILVVVGDAQGHGAFASIVMAIVRAQLHHLAPQIRDPADLLFALDEYLTKCGPVGQSMTMAAMVIDLRKGRMKLAGAGDPIPLLVTSAGACDCTVDVGSVLGNGYLTGRGYRTAERRIDPGDRVLLLTDGVLDDGQIPRFEREELGQLLLEETQRRPIDVVTRVFPEILRKRGVNRLLDDATMLLVTIASHFSS